MKTSMTFPTALLALVCAGFMVFSGCTTQAAQNGQAEWVDLFNGQNLDGWQVLGDGTFYVEDGTIVAEARVGQPNSFLATTQQYDDFELVVDFHIGPHSNSGIQIRSAVYEEETTTSYLSGRLERMERTWAVGRVYGLQVEIDPSDRAWTGGLYEEGRRGWLRPLTDNEPARQAFRAGEWNQLRTVAQGSTIRTWINDVPAAELEDSDATTGFIALQLHGASRPEQDGQKILFRNVRLRPL